MKTSATLSWFVVAAALQFGIVAWTPVRAAIVRSTGTRINLRLMPVDPYDMLTGYSQSLSYEISSPASFSGQPRSDPHTVYATVKRSGNVWLPRSLAEAPPERLPRDEVVIRGTAGRWGRIEYGIETFYIPESEREERGQQMTQVGQRASGLQSGSPGRAYPETLCYAEVIVDKQGNAVLEALHIGGKRYAPH